MQQLKFGIEKFFDLACPLIHHVLNCFGTYRVMFTSNFPMDSVSTSLPHILDAFSDAVIAYAPNALELVFLHNAKQFYRLK